MRLSIVVPMFNERAGLGVFRTQMAEALPILERRHGLRRDDIEVLLVDDGSTDGTGEALEAFTRSEGYRLKRHDLNRGVTAALWTGFEASTGDIIVCADSDCTYPLREIADLLDMLDDATEIVTASPYHPAGGVEGVPPLRLLLSRALSLIYSLVVGRRLYTWTAMFRVYRRRVLETIPWRTSGFLGVTQLLVFPVLAEGHVREHPTVLHRRRYGTSKMRVLAVIVSHLRFILWLIPRRLRLLPMPPASRAKLGPG